MLTGSPAVVVSGDSPGTDAIAPGIDALRSGCATQAIGQPDHRTQPILMVVIGLAGLDVPCSMASPGGKRGAGPGGIQNICRTLATH